ncbi:MAG: DUF2779 domain-containing protein [Candidatus Pelagibacterales bacterium]|nr:MAG: DUF2779 domain-containing protein [Pelagibacterales bacterium]
MAKKYDALSKSKIISGLRCTKKLWFDVHKPIKFETKATIERGKRFGEVVIKNYTKGNGKFLDLTDAWENRVNRTKQAINSDDTNVIFEGAFEYLNTEVRTDVLIRKKKGWELLEAKSAKKFKPEEHIQDIAIQSFIVRECMKKLGHDLISSKLIHINGNFTLENDGDYKDLVNDENDITEEINEEKILNYIKDLMPLTNKNSPNPSIEMGDQCNKPYACDYQDRCKSLLPKTDVTPFTILPYIGKDKKLIEFMKSKGTTDLQKVPSKFFKDRKDYAPGYHKIIQDAHKKNKPWHNEENLKDIFNKFNFPFYFMDFEFVMQGVPIIKGTQPYYKLPFQWSVHKWKSKDKEIDKNKYFLEFNDQDIERQFIESLLKALGEKGTIFAHSAKGVEIKILEKLKEKDSCKDLSDKIDNLINRVEDSMIIAKHNFYSPLMNGDWGIKSIIKAIPGSSVSYDEKDNLAGGDEAQLAWFTYTNPKTFIEEKKKLKKLLLDYCFKDTLAVYYLVKYLMDSSKKQKK